MINAELADSLTFVAAEQMLARLVVQKLLSKEEAKQVQKELQRRLKPTIMNTPGGMVHRDRARGA